MTETTSTGFVGRGAIHSLSRRSLLAGAAAAAGMAGMALAGCSPNTPAGTPRAPGATAKLPSFIPYDGVEADLPSLPNGTSAYFTTFPDPASRYLTTAPGDGGDLSAFLVMTNPPVPVERNPFWQNVNKILGVNLTLTGAPVGDYPNKFQTMVAGGDMPDTCLVLPTVTPRLPDLLEARFTDLGEFLGGDAVKDYPALANIPSHQWLTYNQKTFLIPSPRLPLYRTYVVREDIASKLGLNPQPQSGDDLIALMKGLSDPRSGKTAAVDVLGMLDMVNEMMQTPNKWSVAKGKFTKDYETESFAEALNVVAGMWKSGYINPDAFSPNILSNSAALYASGDSPLMPYPANWSALAAAAVRADPTALSTVITPTSWDGSKTPVGRWMGIGTSYHVGIPKASPERVTAILKVIDALAAPFGTSEHLAFKYGVEGTHWNRDRSGAIVTTEQWTTERVGALTYVGAPATVHNSPWSDVAKAEYEQEKADLDRAVGQPQLGLASDTDITDGTTLTTVINDAISGVIQGRKSMDDWKAAVAEWRSNGGDKIRGEYEEALAAQG